VFQSKQKKRLATHRLLEKAADVESESLAAFSVAAMKLIFFGKKLLATVKFSGRNHRP